MPIQSSDLMPAPAQASQYARSLIEASLDPLVTISTAGTIMDANEAWIKVTGTPRLDLMGTHFSDYFTEPEKAQEGYRRAFAKGPVADYPLTIKHTSGKLTDVLYHASVYKDDAGNVSGVFAVARDVTSRKQASQYARSLIEASLDPLVTISAEGKITDVNEASVKVTGISRHKLIGNDFSNYFTEPEKAKEGYRRAFESGFVADFPLTIKHKSGKLTDVLYNASVYKDDDGNILGVFAAARDISSLKQDNLVLAYKELAFQNEEKEKRADELVIANKELVFQNIEKEKRAAELIVANKELAFQNVEKEKRADELVIANKELVFQNIEKEKRAAELIIANKELAFQNVEKEKRAKELIIANKELVFQNGEKEKRAAELNIANIELAFQNEEKGKRAAELTVANKELAFQNEEKGKRAAELTVANKELAFQNEEKGKRAAELTVANKELAFQNEEKGKRAAELTVANKELAFQNEEKEKRAAELTIANEELVFQNEEKEKRAAELIIANKELAYQNNEKEKRAAELTIANKELAFQNKEKGKRAAELRIANKVLQKAEEDILQLNEELELKVTQRTAQLESANKELESFSYSIAHDLRTPLRAVHGYARMLQKNHGALLDAEASRVISNIKGYATKMGQLIDDLLTFSRLGRLELVKVNTPMNNIVTTLWGEIKSEYAGRNIDFQVNELEAAECDGTTIKQVWQNLISNAVKYSKLNDKAVIEIGSEVSENHIDYYIKDNGVGFDMAYASKLFGVFERLHTEEEFEGTGVGLAIVHRIVTRHGGKVWAEGKVNQGAVFYFSLPRSPLS